MDKKQVEMRIKKINQEVEELEKLVGKDLKFALTEKEETKLITKMLREYKFDDKIKGFSLLVDAIYLTSKITEKANKSQMKDIMEKIAKKNEITAENASALIRYVIKSNWDLKETTELDKLFEGRPGVTEFILTMAEYYKENVYYNVSSKKIFSEIKKNLKRLENIKANPILKKEKPVDRKKVIEKYLVEDGILSYFPGYVYIMDAIIIILEAPELYKKKNLENVYIEVSKKHKMPITKINPIIEDTVKNSFNDKEQNVTAKSFINHIVSKYYEDYLC